ncbi:MAG TPA: tRNA (guanosine(37)-N1)-methyltransferase TrmD [Candidatus Paceibacterota bacterium]|nr:tRNA (guanosine(37)-N1)-methyltransferase TrmD [Candidatus Paceibacterota bacterium]
MKFHVVTLFPEVVDAYAEASILGRAQREKILSIQSYQLRDYVAKTGRAGEWSYKKIDERPYGGGPGMIIQAEPVIRAVEAIQKKIKGSKKAKVLITAAGGKPLTNVYAKNLSKKYSDVIIVCGRYEGIDARAKKVLKAEEVSVGPYILTGGEVPALAIIDATARQIPGVLGKFESLEEGRVASHEMYTRPEVLVHKGKKYRVPKVLLSGNHKLLDAWKNKKRSNPK